MHSELLIDKSKSNCDNKYDLMYGITNNLFSFHFVNSQTGGHSRADLPFPPCAKHQTSFESIRQIRQLIKILV